MIFVLGAIFVAPFVAAGVKNLARPRNDRMPGPAPSQAAPSAPQSTNAAVPKAAGVAGGILAGAAAGKAVGAALDAGIRATGGTDSTQQGLIQDATTAIGAAAGGAAALGVATATIATVALPVAAGAVLVSGAVSAVANMNRAAENDAKRAASIASKGAKATWLDDFKTAVAEIKAGQTATEIIGYHDADPQYTRRGYAGTGANDYVVSVSDVFSTFVTPTTATATHNGVTRTKTVVGYIDIDSGGAHPHKMSVAEVQNIIANEIAREAADDKAAAIAGYGSGSGALVSQAVGTSQLGQSAISTVINGIAATGSKTDRVLAGQNLSDNSDL